MSPDSVWARLVATWRQADYLLIGVVLALSSIGVVMVYSATRRQLEVSGQDPTLFLTRQITWVVVGGSVMVLVASFDHRWLRDFWWLAYGTAVVLLLAVLTPLGTESKGTQAWFQFSAFQLQPSELAKPAVIIAVAAYTALADGFLDLRRLATALGLFAVPVALIFLQPDVGTILVFVAVAMGMLLVAGAQPRHIVVLTMIGALGVGGVLQADVLEDYQRARLTAFLDPAGDAQQTSYNQNQSLIAIGAGGLTGAGLFEGSQTNLSYVPEQHTDFIFTAIGEELGFLGGASVLVLYALLLWRLWRIAHEARDLAGMLITVGVLSMILFQVFQNIGMTMGIMPVTGIPLPFVSYGGSSTIAAFGAIGLALNIGATRHG